MNSVIKFFSAAILAFVVFINSIGNFLGIGDLIPTQSEISTTAVFEESTTEYIEPTTQQIIETTTEYVEPTTLAPQDPVETTAQRVEIGGRYVCFGWSAEEIADALGAATDTVHETMNDGKSITSLVYASDYGKLAVYQLVDGAFSGFYTLNTDAVITDGEKSYSIVASGTLSQSKLSVKEYKDSHQGDIVYAIYVSYNGFSFKSKDLTSQDGQAVLNFHVVNGLRALHGTYALEYCEVAETAARLHCEDMASRDYFDHESPEGGTIADRLHAQGIDFKACAENIAAGDGGNAFSFGNAWYNSYDGHREGMLSTDYDYVGIAFVVTADGATTYGGQNYYRNK